MRHRSEASQTFLLKMLDEAYEKKAWHGPNLRGSLRGLTARQAAWRPAPGRHNIWEIAVHAAYWKYAVRNRLLRGKRGAFPLKGSNWFRRPIESSEAAWRADVALLAAEHVRMREVIARLLRAAPTPNTPRLADLARGIALHDVYHAGQIQLLKRLHKSAKRG